MSKKLPFEDEINRQFEGDDLPLPDREASWQKMQDLLDKEDKERRLPPFFYSCLLGLLLIVCIVWVGWFFYTRQTREASVPTSSHVKSIDRTTASPAGNSKSGISPASPQPAISSTRPDTVLPYANIRGKEPRTKSGSLINASDKVVGRSIRQTITIAVSSAKNRGAKSVGGRDVPDGEDGAPGISSNNRGTRDTVSQPAEQPDTSRPPSDSSHADTVASKRPKNIVQQKNPKPADWSWGAGIAIQQQIPLAGQKAVPYNYYGRSGSLADYIPSAYFRLYNSSRWFVQVEFRFGGPQQTKQVNYSQTQVDSFGANVTRRSLELKKTYYHQIPVSFNIFLTPALSLGGGLMYSRFYSAVSEETVTRKDLISQRETVLNKNIVRIPASTDSFFTRSQIHALLEGQYKWRRLSLGFRYTYGLQPYIRYQLPGEAEKSEKNQSLQVFLRYEWWDKRW